MAEVSSPNDARAASVPPPANLPADAHMPGKPGPGAGAVDNYNSFGGTGSEATAPPGTVPPPAQKPDGACEIRPVQHRYTQAELAFRPDLSHERQDWAAAHAAQKNAPLDVDDKGIHVVKFGETLEDIARRELSREGKPAGDLGRKELEIIAMNRDAYPGIEQNAHLIQPDWQLRVTGCDPGDISHIVIPPLEPPRPQPQPEAPPPPPASVAPPADYVPPPAPVPQGAEVIPPPAFGQESVPPPAPTYMVPRPAVVAVPPPSFMMGIHLGGRFGGAFFGINSGVMAAPPMYSYDQLYGTTGTYYAAPAPVMYIGGGNYWSHRRRGR